jgi:hypothetical protein
LNGGLASLLNKNVKWKRGGLDGWMDQLRGPAGLRVGPVGGACGLL